MHCYVPFVMVLVFTLSQIKRTECVEVKSVVMTQSLIFTSVACRVVYMWNTSSVCTCLYNTPVGYGFKTSV